MWADSDFVTGYWKQVRGNTKYADRTWIFPCSSKLPDMQVSIGGSGSATIPGSAFQGSAICGGRFLHIPSQAVLPLRNNQLNRSIYVSGACIGLLQDGNTGRGRGTMGNPFFESMFMVFDQSKPTIRFAPQA